MTAHQDRYNTTSLRPSVRSLIIDRDYMAHVAKWSYAIRLIERRQDGSSDPYVVIDAGCGVEAPLLSAIARHSMLARGRPIRYHGVDLVRSAPPSVPRWASLHQADLLSWDPPEQAHLVTCLEVIEHMSREDGVTLLSRLRSFVRDDGTVMLATPVADGRRLPRNHIYEWDLADLERAAHDAGFSVSNRFGTFADIRAIKQGVADDPPLRAAWDRLSAYFTNEALSALFAPLFPDRASSILLILEPR